MPVFNSRTVLDVARGVRTFLNVEFGITRGEAPVKRPREVAKGNVRVAPERRPARIAELERKLAARDREITRLREKAGEEDEPYPDRVPPDRLVWIFGTARVGSTWLGAMMEDLPDHAVWHEPIVGELFGSFYYVRAGHRRGRHFILGDRYRGVWLDSIREFVLSGASVRFPEVARSGYLVVKEPNGSVGAPLLTEALPESRMILLVRDPRDVVASELDSSGKEGWLSKSRGSAIGRRTAQVEEDPDGLVEQLARRYVRYLGNSRLAYESHAGPKTLLRYEDLRADTFEEMRRIHADLGVPVDEEELARVVEKHSWKNIPKEEKGEGKFYRKGTPGSWREDLTPGQIEIVERTTEPLLQAFYPEQETELRGPRPGEKVQRRKK